MGAADWRAKRKMHDPVRGVFQVIGFYDKHPWSSPPGTRITGTIVVPGMPAFAAEHKVDQRGRWANVHELPVLVDRAHPEVFAILWDEVDSVSWRQRDLNVAQAQANRLNGAPPATPVEDPGGQGDNAQDRAAQATRAVRDALAGSGLGDVVTVVGAPGRPAPGQPGGGLTPDQATTWTGTTQVAASAVVLAVHDVPIPPGLPGSPPAGAADLTLDITGPDGTSYTATTRIGFSTTAKRARVATVGLTLPVLIDPTDTTRVAINTTLLFG